MTLTRRRLVLFAWMAAFAAAAALLAGLPSPDDTPDRVWIGWTLEAGGGERALPGLYRAPAGARLEGCEGDSSEDTLAVTRIGASPWRMRLRAWLGVREELIGYAATGELVTTADSRWIEFARNPPR